MSRNISRLERERKKTNFQNAFFLKKSSITTGNPIVNDRIINQILLPSFAKTKSQKEYKKKPEKKNLTFKWWRMHTIVYTNSTKERPRPKPQKNKDSTAELEKNFKKIRNDQT